MSLDRCSGSCQVLYSVIFRGLALPWVTYGVRIASFLAVGRRFCEEIANVEVVCLGGLGKGWLHGAKVVSLVCLAGFSHSLLCYLFSQAHHLLGGIVLFFAVLFRCCLPGCCFLLLVCCCSCGLSLIRLSVGCLVIVFFCYVPLWRLGGVDAAGLFSRPLPFLQENLAMGCPIGPSLFVIPWWGYRGWWCDLWHFACFPPVHFYLLFLLWIHSSLSCSLICSLLPRLLPPASSMPRRIFCLLCVNAPWQARSCCVLFAFSTLTLLLPFSLCQKNLTMDFPCGTSLCFHFLIRLFLIVDSSPRRPLQSGSWCLPWMSLLRLSPSISVLYPRSLHFL